MVVPVYGNEGSLPELAERLSALSEVLDGTLEVVFVIDGSPDRSAAVLAEILPRQRFVSRLVSHSRNFGSFAAIRTGMRRTRGRFVGVMAADLQEPPELMVDFFAILADDRADLVVGVRASRDGDPALSAASSRSFWALYRRLVQPEMPPGGIDVFACTDEFRSHLVDLDEAHSSLVSLALWLGFRRETVEYHRLPREHGESGWTLRKKLAYLSDSIFSFTDLPIRLLLGTGFVGVAVSITIALAVLIGRLSGAIHVPGYAATMLVISFFGALNLLGLGIIGSYVFRAFANTKRRPTAVVMSEETFPVSR